MTSSNDDHTDTHQPHDAFFKALFRAFFADLIQLVAPDVAAELDLTRSKPTDTVLTAGLGEPHSAEVDLLVSVPLRDPPENRSSEEDEEQLILVHVEIESRFRRAMDARMLRYVCRIVSQYDRPVFPLVVVLTGGPIALETRTCAHGISAFASVQTRYVAFCLARCNPEDYRDRDEPLAAALIALMRAGDGDRARQKLDALRRIAAFAKQLSSEQRYLLLKTVDTYLTLRGQDAERYAEIMQEQPAEIRDMVPQTYEQFIAEAHQTGVQEGRQLGVQEGRQLGVQEGRQLGVQEGRQLGVQVGEARGRLSLLRRLIERRFGPMSDDERARLDAIDDPDVLDRLAERLLDATSVASLWET
ncbi:MAG: Yae1 family protein [Acidobacteriota bacterium]